MRYLKQLAIAFLVFALFAAACSESDDSAAETDGTATDDDADDPAPSDDDSDDTAPSDDDADDDADDGADDTGDDDTTPEVFDTVVEMFAGEEWTFGTVPDAPVAADAAAEPIKIGMINMEDSPAGSFPELRGAVDAAITWVNTELGGVDGRPIEFVPCVVPFSPEESTACAQKLVQEGVVALVGGIDVNSHASIPVLEENNIPQLGGIPASFVEQQSEIAFFYSGGTPGGMAAFMAHAKENGAEKVMIAHGEFESFTIAANDYGKAVGESLGMDVDVVSFPLLGADYLPILNRAKSNDVDAVLMLAADASCVPIMETFVDLGLRETSQLYMFGACALEEVVEAAGDNIEGVIFGSEGPSEETVEGDIFDAVTEKYATMPAQATGTVGFRGFMNLYGILLELGGDNVTSEGILEISRNAVDRPSYWGHPYTCDGNQVPNLPALCAPQQTYMTIEDGEIALFGDWVDTVALFADAIPS